MTKHQIELVQKTWLEIESVADRAASLFYARLFAIDPATSTLFAAADMRSQRVKLMLTLNEIVSGLHDTRNLEPRLEELGRRHVAYAVRPEHYVAVCEALLWMLGKVLGPSFNDEVHEAWASAYSFIARCMQPPAEST